LIKNWSPDYVDLVQVVHEEVRVPKDFAPYLASHEIFTVVGTCWMVGRWSD